MPFVTWFDPKIANSSTAGRPSDIPALWSLQRLMRYLFFVDCDMENYLAPALNDLVQSHSNRALTDMERYTVDFAKKMLAACGAVRNQG